MQNYDTAPIKTELNKAIEGSENNLRVETEAMIQKFEEYQALTQKYAAEALVLDGQVIKVKASVDSLVKAIEMIKEILYADASPEAIVKLLKAQVKN